MGVGGVFLESPVSLSFYSSCSRGKSERTWPRAKTRRSGTSRALESPLIFVALETSFVLERTTRSLSQKPVTPPPSRLLPCPHFFFRYQKSRVGQSIQNSSNIKARDGVASPYKVFTLLYWYYCVLANK